MEKINYIKSILDLFNENKVNYVILRDYENIDRVLNSKDVDLYVSYSEKYIVDKMMKDDGWFTPRLNTSRYPHVQYYKYAGKVFKIDIVFGLYYGEKLYHLEDEENVIKTRIFDKKNGYYIPSPIEAVKTMLLHVGFDKKELSKKNEDILLGMIKNTNEDDEYSIIAEDLISNRISIKELRDILLSREILSFSFPRETSQRIKTLILKGLKYLRIFFKKKDICIVGVDGSGKSSVINELNDIYGNQIITQYFGTRNFETKIAKKYFEESEKTGEYKLYKFKAIVCVFIDLWYRYLKNRFKYKVIVYDRHPIEIYINTKGIAKKISYVVWKILFPTPKKFFYLYCDAETSLNRKDDIKDVNRFKENKKRMDDYFNSLKNTYKISSDENNQKEITRIVCDYINKEMRDYIQ